MNQLLLWDYLEYSFSSVVDQKTSVKLITQNNQESYS